MWIDDESTMHTAIVYVSSFDTENPSPELQILFVCSFLILEEVADLLFIKMISFPGFGFDGWMNTLDPEIARLGIIPFEIIYPDLAYFITNRRSDTMSDPVFIRLTKNKLNLTVTNHI